VRTGQPRFVDSDRALAASAELRAALAGAGQTQTPAEYRALFDEIVALRDRMRMKEVIARYEALLARRVQPPPYVVGAAADAYLHEREPARASVLYRAALAALPAGQTEPGWQIGLFYAYLESEDFAHAQALIDRLAAQARADLKRPAALAEPDRTRAFEVRITQGLSRLFADDPRAAEQLLDEVLGEAPGNISAATTRATVHAARGQPRAAEAMFRRLLVDGPEDLGARIGHAETLLTLRQYEQAAQAIASLSEEDPENHGVQRVADAWHAHNRWALILDGELARGESVVTGNREYSSEAYLYAPPFAYRYRAYLHAFNAEAEFDRVTATRRRLGFGLERRAPDWELAGELSQDLNGGGPGIGLRAVYEPADAWRLGLGYSSDSDEVPLKAEANDIRASALSLGASYSPHETRRLSAAASHMPFDDGNERTAINMGWFERLLTGPRYKLDLDGSLYASRNTRTDVPYFSPRQDVSFDLTFENHWLTWRRYEHSFTQRLALTAGDYWQEGFGSGPILGLRYEHEWEHARWQTLRYGVGILNRPYDGQQETRSYLYLTLHWRF
jgi:biofilm PGA synthesis protein PgaA